MKVALITNYWKESQGGGIRVYLQNLVRELAASGADVRVIFREGSDPDEVCIPGGQRIFAVRSLSALRDYRPDVISVHGGWHCLFPAVAYKLIHGCTVVQTFHTEPEEALTDRFRLFYQALLNRCDHVTFVSDRLRERTSEVWNLRFPRTEITYAGPRGCRGDFGGGCRVPRAVWYRGPPAGAPRPRPDRPEVQGRRPETPHPGCKPPQGEVSGGRPHRDTEGRFLPGGGGVRTRRRGIRARSLHGRYREPLCATLTLRHLHPYHPRRRTADSAP
ncbi:protein of unknown function [Methanoculleus bourgensis]|uniref:Glycosyltransferase subfamily 4-like N-terminal domain-containing protein n=1 Tax=Methanoculleus bourgensis TaxID=83986 RepID=A0A0X3BK34_9EURY|nr:protein of unknown function [Methanoculleus bourgensis]